MRQSHIWLIGWWELPRPDPAHKELTECCYRASAGKVMEWQMMAGWCHHRTEKMRNCSVGWTLINCTSTEPCSTNQCMFLWRSWDCTPHTQHIHETLQLWTELRLIEVGFWSVRQLFKVSFRWKLISLTLTLTFNQNLCFHFWSKYCRWKARTQGRLFIGDSAGVRLSIVSQPRPEVYYFHCCFSFHFWFKFLAIETCVLPGGVYWW